MVHLRLDCLAALQTLENAVADLLGVSSEHFAKGWLVQCVISHAERFGPQIIISWLNACEACSILDVCVGGVDFMCRKPTRSRNWSLLRGRTQIEFNKTINQGLERLKILFGCATASDALAAACGDMLSRVQALSTSMEINCIDTNILEVAILLTFAWTYDRFWPARLPLA